MVAQNRSVPGAIAERHDIDLTVGAPTFHYGDLRRIHLEPSEESPYDLRPIPARLTRVNHIFWYDHRSLRRLVSNGRFDVIHAWEEPYTYAGYQIARMAARYGGAFVFRTAQSLVKSYPWPFSMFEREVANTASGWVAGGQLVYDAMVTKGFEAERGRVITLGVDMNHFVPVPRTERVALTRELGLTPPVICFVGRLVADKGLDILMAALESVQSEWTLLALGAGPYEQRLRDWAQRRGWTDRVVIKLVDHDAVARYLAAADVLVAPSQTAPNWKEQFGRMLIEAFACGVAVIGSDSGEIPRVIDDAGVVVGEKDVEGWARAIERLLRDEEVRKEVAQRGHDRCRSLYSTDAVADKWVALYTELAP